MQFRRRRDKGGFDIIAATQRHLRTIDGLLPAPYAIADQATSGFGFPVSRTQVGGLVRRLGLPEDSVGVLYRPGADGDVDDWKPLR